MKPAAKRMDIYSEIYPVSSATAIGAGLITMTMGSMPAGMVFVLAGIAVGIAGPVTKSFTERKARKK